MFVADIMTTRVVRVGMDDTLATVRDLFYQHSFHHMLVVDNDDKLMGIISDRDLLRTISPFVGTISELTRDLHTLKRHAHQIMTRRPKTVRSETLIREASVQMLEDGISCLPVLDEDDGVIGVITRKDVLAYYVNKG